MMTEDTAVMEQAIPDAAPELEFVQKLTRDLRNAAKIMGDAEARYLVDIYYQTQKARVAFNNRVKQSEKEGEPCVFLRHVMMQMHAIEKQISYALDKYTESKPIGARMRNIHGIGHILTAGLVAHIDIDRAVYAGNIFRFAGLCPDVKWEKGQKRPWNAALKTICWKIGDSFVKQSGSDKCKYGHVYRAEKAKLEAKNLGGGYAETAARTLTEKKFRDSDTKKKYEAGLLPDGRVDLMARRKAVKLFLSHLHEVWRTMEGHDVPDPWVFMDHEGHEAHCRDGKIRPEGFGW